jgi:hypothetical protein
MTFYGKDTPESFRDHVRRSWHYILSFWGMALAGFAGFLLCVLRMGCGWGTQSVVVVALADLVAAIVFSFKGKKTYDFLREREVAFFRSDRKPFDTIARALTEQRDSV